MKKLNYLFLMTILVLSQTGQAQNVAINEDGSAPNSNAILDVKSLTKGILIPRVSTASRLSIPATKGLLVYDTTTNTFWFHTGAAWQNIAAGTTTTGWSLTGNDNINDTVNFMGTTNLEALIFKVNNQPAGKVDFFSLGNTYYGLNTPNFVSFVGGPTSNAAFGSSALHALTTGTDNTALGSFALERITQGSSNTAVGSHALDSTTTGGTNSAFGFRSLISNTTGEANTAMGTDALPANTSGSKNTAVGEDALSDNTTGNDNTAIGHLALSIISGSANVGVGLSAGGSAVGTGSNNTFLGASAGTSLTVTNNATAIGAGAIVNASNKVRIGNSAVTVIEGQVPFTTPSDGRFKFAVKEDVKGLDFIMQLRPVTYNFDVKRFDEQEAGATGTPASKIIQASYDEAAAIRRSGFIAQEVEQAANASNYNFSGIIKPKTDKDHYSLSYESFVVPLVKSVQELQKLVAAQQKEIDELKQQLHSSK